MLNITQVINRRERKSS